MCLLSVKTFTRLNDKIRKLSEKNALSYKNLIVDAKDTTLRGFRLTILANNYISLSEGKWNEMKILNSEGNNEYETKTSGAPNDQFVEKCIIIPQLMKIYVIKAFSGVFQYCWEKIICSFFPARHTKTFPSQLQSEQPASRRTTIFYIVRQNGHGKRPQIHPSVGGGGEPPSF